MKSVSIKNIFEFKDTSHNRAFENYLANVGKFQGLGLPDICFISKRQQLGMFRSGFQEQSYFHFVQGLCHSSQAEVCTYIQSVVQLQEKNQYQTMQSININKIAYTMYDIFSKTLLVCELDLLQEGCHQLKIIGIQENKHLVQITRPHWEGAYISGVLRSIDSYSEMCTIGKFYNEIRRIDEIIQQFFKIIGNSTNISKICSKSDFPSLHNVIYYLNWPLWILFQYLCKSSQLKVLLTQLEGLGENLLIIYLKFIIYYKLKDYKQCLNVMQKLSEQGKSLNLSKYLIAKVHIKLNDFEGAFVLLKEILMTSFENQVVWTTIASIFRKQHLFQISLILLNKAASLQQEISIDKIIKEQNLHNYRVLSNCDKLENLSDLSQIYEIIHPQSAERIESFVQLSGHPNFNTFLTRSRTISKEHQKALFEQIKKSKQESKISDNLQDFLMCNQLSDIKENQTDWVNQVLKIYIYIGQQRLRQYLSKIFQSEQLSTQELNESNLFLHESEFQLTQTKKTTAQGIKSTQSLDISNHDSDEDEKPSFLKEKKHNLSFDFSNKSISSLSQIKTEKTTISPIKVINKRRFQQSFTYNNIIFEKTVESLESENENAHHINVNQFQNKLRKQANKSSKVKIAGLHQYLNFTLTDQDESQIITSMKNRKEIINSRLFATIDNICKVEQELDRLFPLISKKKQSFSSKDPTQFYKISSSSQTKIQFKYEIKNFYLCTSLIDENDKKSTFCRNAAKAEATFLYKCANIAVTLQKKDLALQILQKINSKMISVQIYSMIFDLIKEDHELLLKHIQKLLLDFCECGVSQLDFIPIWIETILIKLTVILGSNKMLGLLSTLEPDFTFKILRNSILRADNII